MFKFRYNVISGLVLFVQVLSFALIYFKFGASQESDVILISISTIGAAHLVQIMPIDQFMVYFHKQVTRDNESKFWQYSFTIAIVIGVLSFIIAALSLLCVNLFGLSDSLTFKKYSNVAIIFIPALLFYPVLFLNDKLLNSKEYFVASYILSSTTHISIFLSLILLHLIKSNDILVIAWGYVIGVSLGALLSTIIISRNLGYSLNLTLDFNNKYRFHKNSIEMRSGHNLVAVLFPPITNSFLAGLPAGNASLFYYAHRGVVAIYSITAGPMYKLYMSKVSQLWSFGNTEEASKIGNDFQRKSLHLYILIFSLSILSLLILHKVGYSSIEAKINITQSIDFMWIYLLIGVWQAVVLIESKYVGILTVSESSIHFLIVNMAFIIIYSISTFLLYDYFSIYAIVLSAIFAQTINLFLYRKYALIRLKLNRFHS